MKLRNPLNLTARAVAFAVTLVATAALAQQAAGPLAAPELTASGAAAAAPTSTGGPRLRSPAETGNRATTPGDLRPERPVKPQISIPFGKSPAPPTKREERVIKRDTAASGGGVDDAAARCEARADDRLRADCRAKLAREDKGKAPN